MSTTEALLAASGSGGGSNRVSIDDALALHAGEFGRWQLRHFVLAMHTMVMIFADREPAMWCPAGDGLCGDRCAGAAAGWEWEQGSGSSTVAKWGLVCGERYKVGLVQAIYFAGCMMGSGVFGHLSDSFLGRKGSLQLVCFLSGGFGLLTSLSPNYWVYAAFRLLTGFSAGSICFCSFVLATEPIGPSYRGVVGTSTCYFFSGGIAALAGITTLFQSSWRILYIVTSLPSLAFMLIAMPFVSESPRWYLVRCRTDDAMRVLRDIASTNGKSIPHCVGLMLDDEDNIAKKVVETSSVLDVFRSQAMRARLVLLVIITFLCSVVYFGVVVNSLAEMPAYLVTAVLLQHFGRKPLTIGSMLLSGVFCTTASLIPDFGAMRVARMACGVIGIFGMAGTYNLLLVYASELFPTVGSEMGAILAPIVVLLGERVPFVVFGVLAIIGGLLVLCLPETMNKPLYDTMAGMEKGERSTKGGDEVATSNSLI
ncbi:hypothetical protein VPH35_031743 [Triticum aestivum]